MLDHQDPRLKAGVAMSDAAVVMAVWTIVLWFGPHHLQRSKPHSLAMAALITGIAVVLIRQVGLLLSRRCTVRAAEMRLIMRVCAITVAAMLLIDRIWLQNRGVRFYVSEGVVGGVTMLLALTLERGAWRAVLRASRQAGLRERRVIVLGTNSDAKRLVELFRLHPEHGIKVVGVTGSELDAERNLLRHLWLGPAEQTEVIVAKLGLSGVVVAAAPMEQVPVGDLVRRLVHQGLHVHLSTGLTGVDISRFRSLPISREPMLYVEDRKLGITDLIAKRALDIAGSLFLIVVLSPVMLVIGVAVKVCGGGPVLYSQERGGRMGRRFKVHKFRTMRVGADQELDALRTQNERDGALFKMENDPRVTKVGKVLRLSSLDELPQLFNVLAGHMSLVGPRPALPSEIEQFDEQLRMRDQVRPGITGLWQVEARDNPSMDSYKRLDLFYVENWSLLGDIAILLDTAEHLVGRVYRSVRKMPSVPAQQEHVMPTPAPGEPGIAKSA